MILQWLRMLLSPRTKFKAGDNRQAYALEHPEPLLHFSLCSGSHSDPAVHNFSKTILSQLSMLAIFFKEAALYGTGPGRARKSPTLARKKPGPIRAQSRGLHFIGKAWQPKLK